MGALVFFSVPAHGHVNPTLGLVAELTRRGERILYYCTGEFRSGIEAAGAEFRPIPGEPPNPPDAPDLITVGEILLACTQGWLPTLLPELTALSPDAILCDSMCVWGRTAARVLGVRLITCYPSFAARKGTGPPGPLLTLLQLASNPRRGLSSLRAFRRLSRTLSDRYGLPPMSVADIVFDSRGDLGLVFTSASFQVERQAFDDSYKFIGTSLPERPVHHDDFPLAQLEGHRVIYVSLGTVFTKNLSFFERCAEALRDVDATVVLSYGKKVDLTKEISFPRNFIAKPHVPQLEVLRRASLFITHGGMNSVNESLHFGVPMIVHPQGADQYMVASRVERLGAGVWLKFPRFRPSRLRKLTERVLRDPAFAQKCAALGADLRAGGGQVRGAEEVRCFLGRG
jgi:MGT family glycosyltransferase